MLFRDSRKTKLLFRQKSERVNLLFEWHLIKTLVLDLGSQLAKTQVENSTHTTLPPRRLCQEVMKLNEMYPGDASNFFKSTRNKGDSLRAFIFVSPEWSKVLACHPNGCNCILLMNEQCLRWKVFPFVKKLYPQLINRQLMWSVKQAIENCINRQLENSAAFLHLKVVQTVPC